MATAVKPRRKLHIDIVSDTVCPWCYVGARRMEKALTAANVEYDVRWHPFFLNPPGWFPEDGVDVIEHLQDKYGPSVLRGMKYLDEAGAAVGIKFVTAGRRIGDTTDSHRAIMYAEKHGKENEMVKVLFRRYFEEKQYLGDLNVLADAAAEIGLDRAEALSYLQSDEGKADVILSAREWSNKFGRVSGVPYFIVRPEGSERRVAFSGAQDQEYWNELLDEIDKLE